MKWSVKAGFHTVNWFILKWKKNVGTLDWTPTEQNQWSDWGWPKQKKYRQVKECQSCQNFTSTGLTGTTDNQPGQVSQICLPRLSWRCETDSNQLYEAPPLFTDLWLFLLLLLFSVFLYFVLLTKVCKINKMNVWTGCEYDQCELIICTASIYPHYGINIDSMSFLYKERQNWKWNQILSPQDLILTASLSFIVRDFLFYPADMHWRKWILNCYYINTYFKTVIIVYIL